MRRQSRVALAALMALGLSTVARADGGVEALGSARFTVITPNLIRMEFANGGAFVDAASWFARDRAARFTDYKVQRQDNTLTIDTGVIRLTYRDDGQPFSATNLQAVIQSPAGPMTWKPGTKQKDNLGGTNVSLDKIRAAIPIQPGLVARDGWYLLDDSKTVIADADWWKQRPNPANTDWYFFGYGGDYKAAIKSLTAIGGPIPMPRKNTLGAWYSRNWGYKQDEWKQIVNEYHEHDFPLDTVVVDYQWHLKGWTGYTWNKDLLPDPPALLKWFHDQGLAVTLNEHPDTSIAPHEAMYADFMKAMGQDPASQQTIPFDASNKKFLDTFYQFTHVPLEKQGVDFWWLDWTEPKVKDLPSLNGLGMLNETNYKTTAIDGKRGQSFSRWAQWGDHRNPIHFSGDVEVGWPMLAFEVAYTATAGNAGCFFWSHDIGGYRGGRNEESYTRWCQFGALSASLRSHSAGRPDLDRRPWKYPKWAEDSMRVAFHLRSTLMPYVYTTVAQATQSSVPFLRPMYLEHPADENAYHNGQQYYFGDNLLVAPVTMPGGGENRIGWQHVWFPGGTWFNYFTGEKYAGPGETVVTADINEFPLFVRAGVPLPEQPYTERPTTAKIETLVLRCFPGEDGQRGVSRLYEDDGLTDAYKQGASASTELSYESKNGNITVRVGPTQGHFDGQVASRALTILLPATQQGKLISPADAKLTYDPATATNRIDLPPAPIDQERVVQIAAAEIDPAVSRQRAVARRLDGILAKPFAQWTDADRTGLSPAAANAVAAVNGEALVPVNPHPYLYGNDVRLTYFAPPGAAPKPATLSFDSFNENVTLTNGKPVDLTRVAAAVSPENTIRVPGVEKFITISTNGKRLFELAPTDLPYAVGDLALVAKVNTSTGRGEGALDGVADGSPQHPSNEWGAAKEDQSPWVKLIWQEPIEASRVLLYDRPNENDQVLSGKLSFSDGTSLDVGELPNDGKTPAVLTFPKKKISWVKFDVIKTSASTKTVGIGEFGVFNR